MLLTSFISLIPGEAGGTPALFAALSGTASDGALESEIVAGGETIIITLTGDTWVASGGTFDAIRQDIIDGLDSAGAEATGWNAEVRDKEVVGAVVRTSDTVVTITLSAAAAYAITADETITVTVPATALTGGSPLVATTTFDVTNETPAVAEEPGKRRKGAPRRRRKHWWEEDRFYLPPHQRIEEEEPLPHEAAIEDAREALADARKMRAASQAELRRLAGKFGGIVRNAKSVERKIDQAADVLEVEREYRQLGAALSGFVDQLDGLKERKRQRLMRDDEAVVAIISKLDI